MHFDSDSIRVQVVDIQDFELLHQGPCTCSRRNVAYQSNEFLLHYSERLNVCFSAVCCAPYCDITDEMGIGVCEVKVAERAAREEFVSVLQRVKPLMTRE